MNGARIASSAASAISASIASGIILISREAINLAPAAILLSVMFGLWAIMPKDRS